MRYPFFFDRRNISLIHKWWIDLDRVSFLLVIFLIFFGLILVTTSSTIIAEKIFIEKFFFIKKQAALSLLSIVLIILISTFNVKQIKFISVIGFIIFLSILFLTLIIGENIKGSKRWLTILNFNLQPSEFIKTFFILFNSYLISYLYTQKKYSIYYIYLISFLCLFSLVIILINQPDFGMSIMMMLLWLIQAFLFKLQTIFIIIIMILIICFGMLIYFKLGYVALRINNFFNSDSNYQLEKSLEVYRHTNLLGVGPGNGTIKNYIPDVHTDFIFSVIIEEFGIICALMIIFIFFIIFNRVTRKSLLNNDIFFRLSSLGLVSQISLQFILHVGVTTELIPTTGITLPFISYGGSSLISTSIAFGIILALTKRRYNLQIYKNFF